ncbi:MAG: hypothetical protein ACPGVB_01605 [Chitinophagales bacterium]
MNKETKSLFGSPYLIGKVNRDGFMKENYKDWFESNYNTYQVDETVLAPLKDKLKDLTIKVFIGTWCSDSQREIIGGRYGGDKHPYNFEW